jgi:hypothetical protein
MTTPQNPPPRKPEGAPESNWQLKALITTIAAGVLALALKSLGLF